MSKKHKRWKNIKILTVIALIQLLLIGFGCVILHDTRLATEANTEQITLIPDRVEIVHGISIGRHTQKSSHAYLYANDVRYACAEKLGQYDWNDVRDLDGKTLRVIKTADNRIAELACGDTVYYTVEDYNAHQIAELVVGMVLWFVFEFVFVCISILCWFVYGNGQYKKKKARRQTGRGM